MKNTKVVVSCNGDMSVGIQGISTEIDLGFVVALENRKYVRESLERCFSELWDEWVDVDFGPDPMEDCGPNSMAEVGPNPMAYFERQIAENRYLDLTAPRGLTAFANLPDGRELYPAYHPVRLGETSRRQMGSWNGATGEWVCVSLGGRLYRQNRDYGNSVPHPAKWEAFFT